MAGLSIERTNRPALGRGLAHCLEIAVSTTHSGNVAIYKAKPKSFLDTALSYAALGWAVFPLCERAKVPPKGTHGHLGATTDEERIRRWWGQHPSHNVGIATGKISQLLVVDIDVRHDGVANFQRLVEERGGLTPGPTARTGTDGFHLYFQLPEGVLPIGCSAGKIAPGVDTRCCGGYVLAPGSVHPNGKRYTWGQGYSPDDVPLDHPPPWLFNMCREASAASRCSDGVAASPDVWVGLFESGASQGNRDAAATRLFGHLLRKNEPRLALAILKMWNATKCSPPLSDKEINKIVRSLCRRELAKLEDEA